MKRIEYKVKIRSRRYSVFYRRVEDIEDFEFVILTLISRSGNSVKVDELGAQLGFATKHDDSRQIIRDDAESFLLDKFLGLLIEYNLIERKDNEGTVHITEWGERALEKKEKYRFYNAEISLPEFYELKIPKAECFNFNGLGFEIVFRQENELELDQYLEEGIQVVDEYHHDLKDEFWHSSRLDNKLYHIDKIDDEPIGFKKVDITIEAQVDPNKNELSIYFGNSKQDSLLDVLNLKGNENLVQNLILHCNYANFLDSIEIINHQNILPYLSVLNWKEIVQDGRVEWESELMDLIIPGSSHEISSLVTSNCDISFLESNLDAYSSFWNWSIATERINIEFISKNLAEYPWDMIHFIEYVDDEILEVRLDEIISKISDNSEELASLIPKISDELLNMRYMTIQLDLNLFIYDNRDGMEHLILNHLSYNWDWNYVISKANLQIFIDHFEDVKTYILPYANHFLETIIRTKENGNLDYSAETIEQILNVIDTSVFTKVGISSNITSDIEILKLLDDHDLIFWGDSLHQGFEINKNIEWSLDLINEFVSKFHYQDSIDFLSSTIALPNIIEGVNAINWNWDLISKNSFLVSSEGFIEKYQTNLNFIEVAGNIQNDILSTKYDFIRSNITDENIQAFSNSVSQNLSLLQILEKEQAYPGDLRIGNWKTLIENASKEDLISVVIDYSSTVSKISNLQNFSESITKHFTIEEALSNKEFNWDWKYITQKLLEKGITDEELNSNSDKLVWHLIIDTHYSQDDILLKNQLPVISNLISTSESKNIKDAWTAITRKYPDWDFYNAINETINRNDYYWDWDVISSSGKIDFKLKSLKDLKHNINWTSFSENPILEDLFESRNKDLYKDSYAWKSKILEYLESLKDYWDFKSLSRIKAINWSYDIVERFIDKWDWDILSSDKSTLLSEKNRNGESSNPFQYSYSKIEKFKKYINWKIISKRTDLDISEKFVTKYIRKNWDWAELSSNNRFKPSVGFLKDNVAKNWSWSNFSKAEWLTTEYIEEFPSKPWNWELISENKKLNFDAKLISILSTKQNVNWNELILSPNLILDIETIQILSKKQITNFWDLVSKNSLLIINDEMLEMFRFNWNWDLLIKYKKIDINRLDILEKYESSLSPLSWKIISSQLFNPTHEILKRFRHNLDWNTLSEYLALDVSILREFKAYLNWNIVSKNSKIEFNLELTKEFIEVVDIYNLKQNASLTNEAELFLDQYMSTDDRARFVYRLKSEPSQWSGHIYHFTHLSNAVDIINQQKILSRNKAVNSTFADAAGSVVSRRDTAHDYARFYFRPQTPTQFYNECLGKDINSFETKEWKYWTHEYGWKRNNERKQYFPQALSLGLPKCPIPVFFRFDLDEVLKSFNGLCEISDGNMQKENTIKGSISQMIDRFSYTDVYSTIKNTSDRDWRTYLDKSQQEFLVKGELDFSRLRSAEIVVRNEEDKSQLLELIDNDIKVNISVDHWGEYFHNKNKEIKYHIEKNSFDIQSNYEGDGIRMGEFWLKTDISYEIISGKENVLYKKGNKLVFYPSIQLSFKKRGCFSTYFKDKLTDKPEWEVVKHCIQS